MSFLYLCLWAILVSVEAVNSDLVTVSAIEAPLQNAPRILIGPKQPYRPIPVSTPRTKQCVVKGGSKDDSSAILAAVKECNGGGRVVFSKGATYTIGSALDLRKLRSVDLVIQGNIGFSADTSYWQRSAIKYKFQNAACYFAIGGSDVNVYGGGTLNGNGKVWESVFARNKNAIRPILFCVDGLNGGQVSNLAMNNSPQWVNFILNSKNVVYSNIRINSKHKNGDGWDTYRSDNIVIQNSDIDNGDDCVSFKPNSTNIVVQNLHCRGSHGISVGSLGQYRGEIDIVENVYVGNTTLANSSHGARIKCWPGGHNTMGELSGGGGAGRVNNVTYDGMRVSSVEWAVLITQCYGQKDVNKCRSNPSKMKISNIVVRNVSGSTSKKHDPLVGSLVCSTPNSCSNIRVSNINVRSPSGGKAFECKNISKSGLGVSCK